MASYIDLAQLAEDPAFRRRVRVALLDQARSVSQQKINDQVPQAGPQARPLKPARQAKRQALVQRVLHDLSDELVAEWAWAVVPAFQPTPGSVTDQDIADAAIDTQVGDVAWDIMAGVTETDDTP
jgi:hypothetical protein